MRFQYDRNIKMQVKDQQKDKKKLIIYIVVLVVLILGTITYLAFGNYIRPSEYRKETTTKKKTVPVTKQRTTTKPMPDDHDITNGSGLICTLVDDTSSYITYEYRYSFKEDGKLDTFKMKMFFDLETVEYSREQMIEQVEAIVEDYVEKGYQADYSVDDEDNFVVVLFIEADKIPATDAFAGLKRLTPTTAKYNIVRKGGECE